MESTKQVNKDWYRLPGMSSLIHDTNSALGLLKHYNKEIKEMVEGGIIDMAELKKLQEKSAEYIGRMQEALDACYNKIKYL